MRRRQFLSTTVGIAMTSGVVGGTPVSAADTSQPSLEPLGSVEIDKLKEVVVTEDGSTAFAAATTGFATVDVSDPATPTVLAERRDLLSDQPSGPMKGIFDVKYDDDTLLVVGPSNPDPTAINAAVFYDVSDPTAPEQIAVYETGFPIHNSFLLDNIAYLTGNTPSGNELVMIELDGNSIELRGSWSITEIEPGWEEVESHIWAVHDVYVQDGTAYLAHWDAGSWIVDVSDPTSPSLVTKVAGQSPSELAGISRQDRVKAQIEQPGNAHYVAVNDDASLLGVGIESWDTDTEDTTGGPGGIVLWDISAPTGPQKLSEISPPPTSDPTRSGVWTTSHNFDFHEDRLYTSWYQGGVKVFDVSDPADPIELAAYRNTEETSFWTAQYATNDAFVAASGAHFGKDLPNRFYTFPNPDGNPAPTTTDANANANANSTSQSPTPDSSGSLPSAATATPTGADRAKPSSRTDTSTTADSGPGFGIMAVLAGIGIETGRRLRSNDET